MPRPISFSTPNRVYSHTSHKLKQELDPFSPPTMLASQNNAGTHYHPYPATVEVVQGNGASTMGCVTGTVVACQKKDCSTIVGQTAYVAGHTLLYTGKMAINGVSFVAVRTAEAVIQSTVSTAVSTAFISSMVVGGNWVIKSLLKRAFS